ncbi:MAG: putative metal-binding protein [Candidatus Alkanophagales archaeon MCA70_species_2]|nr:putative metal-binding protein [Candidatus Alkanophaga liquidiphilum]
MAGIFERIKGVRGGKMREGRLTTLIGEKLAKVGEEFVFLGMARECEDCKLRSTCMSLEEGRRYRIEAVKDDIRHDCHLHDGGVCVVRVVEPPIPVAIEARKAFEGSKIVFEPPECDESECEQYELCHPLGLKRGDKCTILQTLESLPDVCAKGLSLKLVEVRR